MHVSAAICCFRVYRDNLYLIKTLRCRALERLAKKETAIAGAPVGYDLELLIAPVWAADSAKGR